jgi:hypothetical protein
MGIFDQKVFAVSGRLDRDHLINTIKSHGGTISNTVHKRVYVVLVDSLGTAITQNTQRVRKADKFRLPVVDERFVDACVSAGRVVDISEYLVKLPQRVQSKEDEEAKEVDDGAAVDGGDDNGNRSKRKKDKRTDKEIAKHDKQDKESKKRKTHT